MKKTIKKKTNKKKLPVDDEGNLSRNTLSLSSFAGYCLEHPNERFFQALTNWFGVSKIGYESSDGWRDMWYLEEDVDYKIK